MKRVAAAMGYPNGFRYQPVRDHAFMRFLVCVVLLLSVFLEVCTIQTGIPWAQAAPATSKLTTACPGWGYSLWIPDDWVQHDSKCPNLVYVSSDNYSGLFATAFVHGWWSDARSHSSIIGDFKTFGASAGPLTWQTKTIQGHHYLSAAGNVLVKEGQVDWMWELQSFYSGTLHKFLFLIQTEFGGIVDSQRSLIVNAIVNQIHISTPTS